MAFVSRRVAAPPPEVWRVVADPWTYPRWLIGTVAIRDVDEGWPAPGTAFHHTVGLGPLVLRDRTRSIAVEPGRMLELHVRALPLVTGTVRFELVGGEHDDTVVCFQEEPGRRIVGNLARPLLDPPTHVRNHRSLARLEAYVLERTGTAPTR